jgi:hypothetical protein
VGDLVIKAGDSRTERAQLREQSSHHQGRRLHDGPVRGERPLRADGLHSLLDDRRLSDIVSVEERNERFAASAQCGDQGRPTFDEVGEDSCLLVAKPLQNLRKILLEQMGDAIGESHSILDQIAATLDEAPEHGHGRCLLAEAGELVTMAGQDVDGHLGVRGVILGPAGGEGAAIPRQGRGVDREEYEEVVLEESRDDWALGQLDADGDRGALKRSRKP